MPRRLVERVQADQLNVDDEVVCGVSWTATVAEAVHYPDKTLLKYENATGGNDGYHAQFTVPNTTVFKRVRKQPLEREHARSWMAK